MLRLLTQPLLHGLQRLTSPFIYPLAYLLRHWLRTGEVAMRHEQAAQCGVVLWGHRRGWGWLWLWLDDSIHAEGKLVYGQDIDYCAYGNRNAIIEKLPDGRFREFARAWHWSAVRNCAINFSWVTALSDMTDEEILHGKKPRNFVARRYYGNGEARLYVQFYPWGDLRFKVGWLSNGRFELQLRERKP